ncbi:hypothetical protein SAMN05444920_1011004 [Nonomuraea solani]|uniref:Catalytic LigB subunit of aromatic ring-opening dioxygenase n=1 Tax=Nonomuraea solani TaxID=1144553 RepID=A0A1H5VVW9_9ACTN|nr:hypothetical protein [Nonomuraea solani]SEF91402.1 hypothetical protein SAMN05444920_1011004 [Nonomuraea solani]
MIVAVVCVPQAPLLLPGVTGRPVAEVDKLRESAASAAGGLLDQELDDVIVLAAAPRTGGYPADARDPADRVAPGSHRSLAGPTGADGLPVALAVGRSFLPPTTTPLTLYGIASDAPPDLCLEVGRRLAAGEGQRAAEERRPEAERRQPEAGRGRPAVGPGRTGLIVAADGSARRGEKAPGYLDPRAADLDAQIGRALGTGDVTRLSALDPATCTALLVAGRAAWQVMAGACEGTRWLAHLRYEDDPFGVAYWVATWTRENETHRTPTP